MASKERITAIDMTEAWKKADAIFGGDYELDEVASKNAGYKVYRSTAEGKYYWYICDLGTRLEVNMDKETVNIWISDEKRYTADEVKQIVVATMAKLKAAGEIKEALRHVEKSEVLNVVLNSVRNIENQCWGELSKFGL